MMNVAKGLRQKDETHCTDRVLLTLGDNASNHSAVLLTMSRANADHSSFCDSSVSDFHHVLRVCEGTTSYTSVLNCVEDWYDAGRGHIIIFADNLSSIFRESVHIRRMRLDALAFGGRGRAMMRISLTERHTVAHRLD